MELGNYINNLIHLSRYDCNQSIACRSPVSKRSSLLLSPGRNSPLRTPGKRQSLRRSVLLNSAKKPVFKVTDMVTDDQEENADKANADCEPESKARTPRRVSRKLVAALKASPAVLGRL